MKLYIKLKNIILSLFNHRTIGARSLVVQDNKILLIEHTYISGWYSIGGAVDKGESPRDAIIRELEEEVGIVTSTPPKLFNVYHNIFEKRDDYVALYICDDFTESDKICTREIKQKHWFDFNNLPQNISPSTKRRINEYLGLEPISDKW